MFKKDLVDFCAKEAGVSKKNTEAVIEAFFKAVETTDEVSVRGFGTFKHVTVEAHEARNPRNGEKVQVAEKTVIKFKASK